ncbi:DNA-binding protein WhiA [Lactobacillus sp. CC-MHH1034]|uniref:DNA-binding protein WhiA n=1 Tax=Agrilactobacillus fermenti TaxID=2586909 RepID=UPI001E615007|nr:DNA-binding protein WhiA [Agrilactobacillus fermenti]MCD2256857.1 DNA-binding protein WhiA [Agrilactobacillus fermenti]
MASYASQVKKELTNLEVHPEHARAELAALIRMNGSLDLVDHHFLLVIQTENPAIARRIYALIRQLYQIEARLSVQRKMKLKKNNLYLVRLMQHSELVLCDLGIIHGDSWLIQTKIPDKILNAEQRMRSYLRGAFLAGGSVNSPETSRYHLEIYSLHEDHNQGILQMMNHFDLHAKTTERRNGYVAYIKEAEKISDFLQVVGATKAMLSFEDVRIVRDMRNSVNRLVNCETANMNKTIDAATRQLENIKFLKNTVGFERLPEKLREIAQLRLDNPEMSLKELAEIVPSGAISKSGINHRLRKLSQLAEQKRQDLVS